MADFGQIIKAAGIVLDNLGQPLSSQANKFKYDMILEQIDPHTQQPLPNGLSFVFSGDDLPDGPVKLFDGDLKTVRKEYINNTIPDTQVINTFERNLELKGCFWAIDANGVSPIDKVELLHAMRLSGIPCRLTYMNGRIVRLGFIVHFDAPVSDETDIEWELHFEIYQIGDTNLISNVLPPLTSVVGRFQDIADRIDNGVSAFANVLAALGNPTMARSLRNDLHGIINPVVNTINAAGAAKTVYQASGSNFNNMSQQTFKDFGTKVTNAALNANDAMNYARSIPLTPTGSAASSGGLPATLQRRATVRAASITTSRVAQDFSLMQKDAIKLYNNTQQIHIFGQNDSLRSISYQYYGNANRWQDIARANNVTDPQQLKMGMSLVIPK